MRTESEAWDDYPPCDGLLEVPEEAEPPRQRDGEDDPFERG